MKVIAVSIPKQQYNPGEVIPIQVTVLWQFGDTGGILIAGVRAAGTSWWSAMGTQQVGNPGIGIPDIFMTNKNQTIEVDIFAPQDVGYYQIGIREQSESEVSVSGGAEIRVVPETPVVSSGQGVVRAVPNRADTGDAVLYVDDTPVGNLPGTGMYVTLTAGTHQLSASGSQYGTASPVSVIVLPGSTQMVTLPLVAGGQQTDWGKYGPIAVGAVVGLAIIYFAFMREG